MIYNRKINHFKNANANLYNAYFRSKAPQKCIPSSPSGRKLFNIQGSLGKSHSSDDNEVNEDDKNNKQKKIDVKESGVCLVM